MSNARIRRYLEEQPASMIAFLIDNGWVHDDCGILNAHYHNIREGIMVASRATQNMTPVPVPPMMAVRERL